MGGTHSCHFGVHCVIFGCWMPENSYGWQFNSVLLLDLDLDLDGMDVIVLYYHHHITMLDGGGVATVGWGGKHKGVDLFEVSC